ncbi:MAG: substrate-binding domain-containing protein [Actinophytocola sp.]|uniref:serine/threonine-protein kinase n=1 Tax=Actinophytocola sp. TaxID=1872138 RepID=UPI003D6A7AB8
MLEPLAENDPPRVGPFAIEGRLGTSGHVYLGRDAVGVAAAVTVVRVEQAVDPRFRHRFAAEVTAAGRVRHRHVAALIDAHADADHPWLATEYVDGPPLREVVAEWGPLPVAEVLRVTAGVAGALGAIREAGLVHGSLSADTVRLTPEGPRVIGLGVGEHAGAAADVVALGKLVTFLAGAEDELPEPLRSLVVRCRAADPADRPTPAALAAAAIAGESLAYETASPPENPLDLSAGIPSDAIVGPIPADAEPETGVVADPLAYAPAAPPENPLDLSAGIPGDAVVGPIDADATVEDEPAAPLAYPATTPPANPLDLSAGIPGDAVVGPISADATTEELSTQPAYAAAAPPANPVDLSAAIAGDAVVGPIDAAAPEEPSTSPSYAAAAPPANPIDLSAGIAGDAIVGPVDVTGDAAAEDAPSKSLAYAATAPPANPVDLSAGIAADAVVGPVDATAEPAAEPSEPLAGAVAVAPAEASVEPSGGVAVVDAPTGTGVVTAPPIDPHDLAALRAAADAIEAEAAPVADARPSGAAARVIEPVTYGAPGKDKPRSASPAPGRRPNPRRRRLVGAVVAVLLAAAAITVPLLQDNTTDGTPVPALESVTPAAGDDPTTSRPACSGARTITASGSSLQHDAMLTIAEQWTGRCAGSTLDYSPDGTPDGVARFAAGEADFAVVDHVLGENQGEIAAAAARCSGIGAPADKNLVLQLPMVLTPVAVTYHLPSVAELQLDAPALTAIFSGRLTRWNDRAVAELNPGVRLPATAVTVVARADEAQSTQTFQQFLTATGGWRSGSGPEFGGRAQLPQQSDADVLAAVRSVEGAIGYLPFPLARAAQEPVVMIATGDGKGIIPDADAVHAAVDAALHDTADLTALPDAIYRAGADQVGDGTPPYPLVHVGYVIACTQYPDQGTTAAIRDFLLTALATQVQSVDGYQLPFGDLRLVLVDLVERTY